MKKNSLILLFWIIALITAFSLHSNGQLVQKLEHASDISITNDRPELLADETTITDTKTGARIECSNDKVHFKLYEKWQHTFIRYSWKWKKDRHGAYKEYTITVSEKDANLIREWAKTNL